VQQWKHVRSPFSAITTCMSINSNKLVLETETTKKAYT